MARRNSFYCPNCGATNDNEAQECIICGTRVGRNNQQRSANPIIVGSPSLYDPAEGEDDLMVRGLLGAPIAALVGIAICLILSAGLGAAVVYFLGNDDDEPVQQQAIVTQTLDPDAPIVTTLPPPTPLPTNTRPAPPLLPTVTLLPPSATPTETPGPCIQVAGPGDTVYGMAIRCGHKHLSIVPLIVELNTGLESDSALREGQQLEIPWPTPTEDPNASTLLQGSGEGGTGGVADTSDGNTLAQLSPNSNTPEGIATLFVEPTLRPGLMWHVIEKDQTLITLAGLYNTDAKVLSDLNPEIEFRQCDFGMRYGGENCSVIFYERQRVRVPAPPATATIPPTSSGSETPTPSPSPTFNVPAVFSPNEDEEFNANTLITLRWSASGSLAPNEVYLLTLQNLDTNRTFQARTTELYLVMRDEWQPRRSGNFYFEWTVSIATIDGDQIVSTRQQTQPRHFYWQGKP